MDENLLVPAYIFILMGAVGIWVVDYSGITETFLGMRGLVFLILAVGIMLMPAGVLRGGSGSKKSMAVLAAVIVFSAGIIGIPAYQTATSPVEGAPSEVEVTKTIHLIAAEFAFNNTNPTLTVKKGEIIKFEVVNNGAVIHDLVVTEKAKTPVIEVGQTGSFIFKAIEPGTYEYFCSIPGHRQLGMLGNLIVGE